MREKVKEQEENFEDKVKMLHTSILQTIYSLYSTIFHLSLTRFNMVFQIQAVERSAGTRRKRWAERAGRSVAGFLGMFGECCRGMGSCQIQKRIRDKSSSGTGNDRDGGVYHHSESFYYNGSTDDEYDEDEDKK